MQLEPIDDVELPALTAGAQHVDLVAKHGILEHQLLSGQDGVDRDARKFAYLLTWRQLRPQSLHASQAGFEMLGEPIRHLEYEHGSRSSHLPNTSFRQIRAGMCAW